MEKEKEMKEEEMEWVEREDLDFVLGVALRKERGLYRGLNEREELGDIVSEH
ncbi:hypothetical protein [Neisseria sicca]|uniref:hypothetical protein n=1 Tax=Neisseria sicca TaxID=490 RepID=UPI001649DDDA|nr:hypothetical protein [Neisseria sicca]